MRNVSVRLLLDNQTWQWYLSDSKWTIRLKESTIDLFIYVLTAGPLPLFSSHTHTQSLTHFVFCPPSATLPRTHTSSLLIQTPSMCWEKQEREGAFYSRRMNIGKTLVCLLLKLDYCSLPVQPVVWPTDSGAGAQTQAAATVQGDLSWTVNPLR